MLIASSLSSNFIDAEVVFVLGVFLGTWGDKSFFPFHSNSSNDFFITLKLQTFIFDCLIPPSLLFKDLLFVMIKYKHLRNA